MSAKIHDYVQPTSPNGTRTAEIAKVPLQEQLPQRSTLSKWFLPHQETQLVAQQSSSGVFLPWPLLAIIVTLAIVLVTGLVTIQVQVSNLSTTLLLRDQDHARQVDELKAQIAKETERRELTDLKVADLREKQAARRN